MTSLHPKFWHELFEDDNFKYSPKVLLQNLFETEDVYVSSKPEFHSR